MNIVLWSIQILLMLLFLLGGSTKLILPIEEMTAEVALPEAFLRFIGVAELAGALGLVLPMLLRIRPMLTPLAAAGLLIIMTGATVLTAVTMDAVLALIPLAVGLLVAFVAYGRWHLLAAEMSGQQQERVSASA
ncbi:MAG: DoxX family protein [Chloroflexota bacterium]